MKQPVERRLAAILAADVAGYSRLMGADEEGTLEHLKAHRRELVDPKIREHRGRIVKTTGDGLLAEFPSVVDGVRCAVEIQRGMIDRNVEAPEDKRIAFRMGINLGDVIIDGGDIYGDGVNIAARLEALAEPGGICVTRTVRNQIRDKLLYAFEDMGEQSVKNIARPVRADAMSAAAVASTPLVAPLAQPNLLPHRLPLRLGVAAASIATVIAIGAAAWWMWPSRNLPTVSPPAPTADDPHVSPAVETAQVRRLSIVVLPFTNMSNDLEQEYFADGITDDLTTDLSRIAGSFVIARNTAFTYKGKPVEVTQIARDLGVRYVLEGSVRRLGDRVQVNVQLIDGETGAHVWADRFDTDRHDLAAAQGEITGRLARTLDLALEQAAGQRREQERVTNPDARELVMRGRALQSRPRPNGPQTEALSLFEQALKLDPRSIDAKVGIASILTADILDGYSSSIQQDEERAQTLLLEALEADPDRSLTHTWLGILRRGQHRWGDARSELEMAKALDRNNSRAIRHIGMLLEFTGQPEAAIPYLEKRLRLNPREGAGLGLQLLGAAYLFIGQVDRAVDLHRKAISENPKIFWFHLWLAGALGLKMRSTRQKERLRSRSASNQR
jgi:TolB-like protein/class 3 adenylate cyclase/cytochrome c-type biogenesis protein CcmH/NrfG